jgi:hypothetical protein
LSYVWVNFSGGWQRCTLCSRKLKIGGNENGVTRKINIGLGGEFYDGKDLYKDGLSKQDKQYTCFEPCLLAHIDQHNPERFYNRKKKVFPSFLMQKNIVNLKEIVHFKLLWSDDVLKVLAPNNNKKIVVHFNIFDEDEKDE